MKETITAILSAPLIALIGFAWVGSIPLAILYGDKIDVALSFVIPMYGSIVALMHWLG